MLTPENKMLLDKNGFLNLGKLLTSYQVRAINQKIDELQRSEGDQAGSELFDSKYIRHPKEEGADRLADLVNKGEIFDLFYTQPHMLEVVEAILGPDYKLSSLNYRAAKPGMGKQKLHVDWKNGLPHGTYKVCNSIWLLDDFTFENGATRLIPGSHKWDLLPDQALENPFGEHRDQKLLIAPAGTVFIFNAHIWHGGTTNLTDQARRSIHSYFCTLDEHQQIDQKKYITAETRDRIGAFGQKILDV